MKVHITLSRVVRGDADAKKAALARIAEAARISEYNVQRFDRHGIISTDIEPVYLNLIREMEEVQAVEADEPKYATS